MTTSRALKFFRDQSVGCVLGLAVLSLLLAAKASPFANRKAAEIDPVPPVYPANPRELSPVFQKDNPESVAELRLMQRHIEALVRQVSPTVVAVELGFVTGSGVIISPDGLVLTAGHVCGRPGRKVVFRFPDGSTADGKTLGVNENDDTGLMKITTPGPWPYAPLGDLKHARLGNWTLALGHPGGFDLKRSLVVRLGRIVRMAPDVLQTDCTLSPGDSGGPLFDMYGRVIAIHAAISDAMTENFHVPISDYYGDWAQLASGTLMRDTSDQPARAYCGATVETDPDGCHLSAIAADSPASRAGLKIGDVVVTVQGRHIRTSFGFERQLERASPGDTLHVEVKRGPDLLSFDMKLEAEPEDE